MKSNAYEPNQASHELTKTRDMFKKYTEYDKSMKQSIASDTINTKHNY